MFIPYFVINVTTEYLEEYSIVTNFLACLLPSSAVGFGINAVLVKEWGSAGLHWKNLFETTFDHGLSVGVVIIALILSSIISVLLMAHLELIFPDNEKPKEWYFPFVYLYKKYFYKNYEFLDESQPSVANNDFFENEPNINSTIQVKELTKTYKRKQFVLDEINLKAYSNQVTVVLGENGSGKSTLMSILGGLRKATSGKVFMMGYNIENYSKTVRNSLGICQQTIELMNDLSIQDHIIFFSKLRGMTDSQSNEELQKFVDALGFTEYLNKSARHLKMEIRRKLCVVLPFCGNSKIVLLDDPTMGLESNSRKQIWDMIKEEKKHRTVIIATNSTKEALTVGDRIGILNGGSIKAMGSPSFLKKCFGIGYKIKCLKEKDDCAVDQVTRILKIFVPDVKVFSENSNELIYNLNEYYQPIFPRMLQCLENEMANIGISEISVNMTELESIFER